MGARDGGADTLIMRVDRSIARLEAELADRIGAVAVAGLRAALSADWGDPPSC